jgi:hypothetical protein
MIGNNSNQTRSTPTLTGEEISIILLYYITAFLIIIISLIFINMRI